MKTNFRFAWSARTALGTISCASLFSVTAAFAAPPSGAGVDVTSPVTAISADDLAALPSSRGIEVFVTASRGVEESPLSVAQSTSTVERTTLDTNEYVDVHDAIQDLPNIGLAPAEGNPNFWQQGFSIRGLGAQRVLTLTDGVRQAGQGIGYGGGNLSLYDTYGIERIEVIRGPASVLYGTDAFGGVINIITRNPRVRDEFGVNGGLRYMYDSSRDLNRYGGYIDFGDRAYGTVFGMSYTDSGEPNLPHDYDPKSGSYRELGFWGKTDFRFTEDTTLRILGSVDRNSDVLITDNTITLPIATFPPPGSSIPITSPLYFTFPTYQRSLLGTELTTENISPTFELLKTGVYWQQIYRRFHRETAFFPTFSPGFAGPPFFVDPSATVTTSETNTRDRVNTIEWQTQGRFNFEPHRLTVGLDFGYDNAYLPETETQRVVAQAGIGPVVREPSTVERLRADADQYRIGVYAEDSWNLNPFEVTPGIRLDYFRVENSESNFSDDAYGISGSLRTLYHQSEQQSLYFTLATGFRAPDLGERFQDGIVNLGAPSRVIGREDLDPEHSYSAEWGLKRRDGNLDTDFSMFINHITEYIGTETIGPVDGFLTDQFNNLGTVNLYGGEIAARYRINDQWSVYANASRTWSREDDLVDLLDWAFNYGTDYQIPVNTDLVRAINVGLSARSLVDPKDKPETGGRSAFKGAGFTVVDLKLNLELGKTRFGTGRIISGVRNLFDKEYREPFFEHYQPSRNVYAGIQFDF